jgi:cell wall-associated NlpC family hydrolase
MRGTRIVPLALISQVALILGLGAAVAEPAVAAARDGHCESGEFCYYYNSNNQGSISDFTESAGNYGTSQPSCYEFKGAGNGQGQCIKNEAASVWNRSSKTVRVYLNSYYEGSYQDIAPGYEGQLNSTLYNNNASHRFLNDSSDGGHARDGSCQSGEFCYYYNSNNQGSISDFTDSVGDYGTSQPSCYEFKGAGNGQGRCIKNEAASVWNRSSKTVRVYFNSRHTGTSQDIGPGYKGQLNSTLYNNNASHRFLTDSGGGDTDGSRSEKIEDIIDAARSQTGQGLTYSWGAGGKSGPSYGTCCSPTGSDDRDRFGFDCSGLTEYTFWQGAGIDIGGHSSLQSTKGTVISMSDKQRGDLIFWGNPGSTWHVAIYLGNDEMIEAAPPRDQNSVHVINVYGGDFAVRVF